jgi:hypothetical protein
MSRRYGATNRSRSRIAKWCGKECGCFYCTGQLDSKFKNREYLLRKIKEQEILDFKYGVTNDKRNIDYDR